VNRIRRSEHRENQKKAFQEHGKTVAKRVPFATPRLKKIGFSSFERSGDFSRQIHHMEAAEAAGPTPIIKPSALSDL
jgi:hypothetical protein